MKTYLTAGLVSFALSFLFLLAWIPLLKRLKAGQNILSYVKEHAGKQGTPTMGGAAFVLAACLAAIFFAEEKDRLLFVTCAIGAAFMFVGALDDGIKMIKKRNEGLKPYQKIFFQTSIALIAGVYCCLNGYTLLYLPFTGLAFDLGWWMLPFSSFVFIATVNCVNLTDGLDGLAAFSSSAFFFCFALLIERQGEFASLSLVGYCLTGALLAFLIFNTHRASVFMGDTGSLSLGGFAAAIAVFSGDLLYILLIGCVFVFSGISVILQVIYYKATGKRLFLMAPAHHHFQQKGYSESKISYAYAAVTLLLGVLCVLGVN